MAARIEAGVRVPETQDTASQKGSQAPASLSHDQVNDLRSLLAKVLHEEASSEYGVTLNTCLKDGRDLTAEERKLIDHYLFVFGTARHCERVVGSGAIQWTRKPVRPNERVVLALAKGVG